MFSRGNPDNVYRYDEQFNQVDYQFVNIDSRGIVNIQLMESCTENYWSEDFYRLNTDF